MTKELDINPVILVSSASDNGLFDLWSLMKGYRTHFQGEGICRAYVVSSDRVIMSMLVGNMCSKL